MHLFPVSPPVAVYSIQLKPHHLAFLLPAIQSWMWLPSLHFIWRNNALQHKEEEEMSDPPPPFSPKAESFF